MLVSCQTWLPFKWSILIELFAWLGNLGYWRALRHRTCRGDKSGRRVCRVVKKFLRGAVTEQTPAQALALALRIGLYGLESSDGYFARNPV